MGVAAEILQHIFRTTEGRLDSRGEGPHLPPGLVRQTSDGETLTTEYGAKTMDIDPKTHNIFLSTADFAEAPASSAEHPHPSRRPIPGTFHVLIYGRWRLGTNC